VKEDSGAGEWGLDSETVETAGLCGWAKKFMGLDLSLSFFRSPRGLKKTEWFTVGECLGGRA